MLHHSERVHMNNNNLVDNNFMEALLTDSVINFTRPISATEM